MDTPFPNLVQFDQEISNSYIQLVKPLGKRSPAWVSAWFEFYFLPMGKDAVRLDKSNPSRAQRLKMLKLDRDALLKVLRAACASCDQYLINRLTFAVSRIEAEISIISRTNGGANTGPGKGAITPKDWMAAGLVELHLFLKRKEPSPRNLKLAAILVSLLDTLGIFRDPIGNRLNGARKAFELALSASGKVNNPELRKHDALHDEIVLARLHTRRSLEQCKMRGGAPWGFPGMNGPVVVYDSKTEI